ncbi:MAG TPA: hypothetical protein VKZ98_00305 [Aquaticitalea sp.]|nr:hypothetical protein [Aquaticitalea sp.]
MTLKRKQNNRYGACIPGPQAQKGVRGFSKKGLKKIALAVWAYGCGVYL